MTHIQFNLKDLNTQLVKPEAKPGAFHSYKVKIFDGKEQFASLAKISHAVLASYKKNPIAVTLGDLHKFIQISGELGKSSYKVEGRQNIFLRIWRSIGRYFDKKFESSFLDSLKTLEQLMLKKLDRSTASAADLYAASELSKSELLSVILLDQACKKDPENTLYAEQFKERLAKIKENPPTFTERTPKEALEFFSNQGLAEAQCAFGVYWNVQGDTVKAKSYFEKSAEQGDKGAISRLLSQLRSDKESRVNDAEIIKYLRQAKSWWGGNLIGFALERTYEETKNCAEAIDHKTKFTLGEIDYFALLAECVQDDSELLPMEIARAKAQLGLKEALISASLGDSEAMIKIAESKSDMDWFRRAVKAQGEEIEILKSKLKERDVS